MKKMDSVFPTIFILSVFLFLLSPDRNRNGIKAEEIRHPAVAGVFYPGSSSKLRDTITELLNNVHENQPSEKCLAAVAPHAGYVYSGAVAAHTHKQISGVNFDTLVIIGHDTGQAGVVAYISNADYFETPLGKVPLDQEMIAKMITFHPGIKTESFIHARDHTIEVHLPFLQVLKKKCRIIPILFGDPTPENCSILARATLFAAGKKKVFVLASTDLSHYPSYEDSCTLDKSTLASLTALDSDLLLNQLKKKEKDSSIPNLVTTMCAKGGVGTAILFSKALGADAVRILYYANSGDVPNGDRSRVVGYCSAVMVKSGSKTFP